MGITTCSTSKVLNNLCLVMIFSGEPLRAQIQQSHNVIVFLLSRMKEKEKVNAGGGRSKIK